MQLSFAVLIAVVLALLALVLPSCQGSMCCLGRTAIIGTTVKFTFKATGMFQGVIGNSEGAGIIIGQDDSTDTMLRNRSISWSSSGDEFIVKILATVENNCTQVYGISDNERTDTYQLIVVTGLPGPPGAPILTVTNLTTLTLTWSAPWPHSISNYTVTVTNTSSGLVSQYTVNEEQFVLRGGGQCDELVFTVEAETDVGSSGTSPNISGGFPEGFSSDSYNVSSQILCTSSSLDNGYIVTNVTGLQHCKYEHLDYHFTVHTDDGRVIHNSTTLNALINITENVTCNTQYIVSVTVTNEAGEIATASVLLGTKLTIPTATISLSHTEPASSLYTSTNQILSPTHTGTINSATSTPLPDTIDVILITTVISLLLLILFLLSVVITVLIIILKHKTKTDIRVRGNATPQNWTSNPTYDTNAGPEPTYEQIDWVRPPIRSLPPSPGPSNSLQGSNNQSDTQAQERSHTMLAVSPAHSLDNEEYITMSSAYCGDETVRYSRSPTRMGSATSRGRLLPAIHVSNPTLFGHAQC